MVGSQYKKVTQALRYLISRSDHDRVKILLLMKLVWAADRYHTRKYASLITDYDYRALPQGPLSSIAYDIADASDFLSTEQIAYSEKYVARTGHDVVGIAPPETDYLAETDREALDWAWNTFGHMDRYAVVDITHSYPEWKKFESFFVNGAAAKEINVADFFENPENDKYFAEDSTKLEASRALFEENLGIHKLIKG